MPTEYTAPVNLLLTYGDCSQAEANAPWPDYLALGFTAAHVPELIRMATDTEFSRADTESLQVWGPVHAWRTLAQLKAVKAVTPLTALYDVDEVDDWVFEELPTVFELMGPLAIPVLVDALSRTAPKLAGSMGLVESIARIGETYLEARETCITHLTEFLTNFTAHDPELNAQVVWTLMDLHAVAALPVIRAAFAQEYVDLSVVGDLEDVEIEMGLRTARAIPADCPSPRDRFPDLDEHIEQWGGRPVKKTKVGRNDPCPCGSGKKYKRCCLNNPDGQVHEEYLAMFSKQKIRLAQSQKEVIWDMIRKKKPNEAIKFLQTLTSADPRLLADYVKRQEFLAVEPRKPAQ
jgi:hypothetical protein